MNKTSINQAELAKFNKTEQEWWDINGEFQLLHIINPLRIEYIIAQINKHFSNRNYNELKLLDIGCGGGLISVPLARMNFDVTSLDANNYNIEALSAHIKQHNITLKLIANTLEEHVKTFQKYDIIICLEVIEHIENPAEFLKNINSILNKGGIVILSTINRTCKSYAFAIIMAEYVLRMVKRGTHEYKKFLRPSEIVGYLSDTELKLQELKGLEMSPWSRKWTLTDNIDVNYFAIFKKS
ncbi:MAG: bifunctional 2-polyprenyl-6-hydroxyphenol methylase/3-demethylubiquinol 3-O-methyltransferase UbiG [Rickettsiaceae bacterium]|nr:bifunctional 2-polyprenyl-6-hydroxyphenol methylase/3-demethylubiquinol 3-O-methyltransferase UbiG [Rickettsiaceae bacterium]